MQPSGFVPSHAELSGTQTPPFRSGVHTQVPPASHAHALGALPCVVSHTKPGSQPVPEQPAGFGPSHPVGSGTQIPPPTSGVHTHVVVVASQAHALGALPCVVSQTYPAAHPVSRQPCGFSPSHSPQSGSG